MLSIRFKTIINQETEVQLARCIGMVCNLGFHPTIDEIRVNNFYFENH